MGGHDPYSSSKGCAELVTAAYRQSFFSDQTLIASARAGNVIGGGDWSLNRLIPDCVRAWSNNEKVFLRNPYSTRPWQHVLEPIKGYLLLAETMTTKGNEFCQSYNFGPHQSSNKTVKELVEKIVTIWPGKWEFNTSLNQNFHEAKLLNLQIDKVGHLLSWYPKWDFDKTVEITVDWYKSVYEGYETFEKVLENIKEYESS